MSSALRTLVWALLVGCAASPSAEDTTDVTAANGSTSSSYDRARAGLAFLQLWDKLLAKDATLTVHLIHAEAMRRWANILGVTFEHRTGGATGPGIAASYDGDVQVVWDSMATYLLGTSLLPFKNLQLIPWDSSAKLLSRGTIRRLLAARDAAARATEPQALVTAASEVSFGELTAKRNDTNQALRDVVTLAAGQPPSDRVLALYRSYLETRHLVPKELSAVAWAREITPVFQAEEFAVRQLQRAHPDLKSFR